MKLLLSLLALAAAGCGPKLPADRRFARDVAEAVDDGDHRCARSGEADDVIGRCKTLRNALKTHLLEADRDLDAGAK